MPYNVLKRPQDFPPAWVTAIEVAVRHPGKWFQIASKGRELEVSSTLRKLRLLRDSFKVFPLAYPQIREALRHGQIGFRRNPATHFQAPGSRHNIVIEVRFHVPQDSLETLRGILEEHRKRG